MKVGVIDTNSNLRTLLAQTHPRVTFVDLICQQEERLALVSDKIIKEIADADIFIINIEAGFENTYRSDCLGVEIVFWLRIKHALGKPIVLTGFQTIEQILRNHPSYTVIFAQNVYYQDILSGFDVLNCLDGIPLLVKSQIYSKYLPHARNQFNIEFTRHEDANWFGMKALWDAHKCRKYGNFHKDYPTLVKEKLQTLNNLLAFFIYKSFQPTIEEIIGIHEKRLSERRSQIQRNIKSNTQEDSANYYNKTIEIFEFEELLRLCKEEQTQIQKNINDQNYWQSLSDAGQGEAERKKVIERENNIKKEISEITVYIKQIKDELFQLSSKINEKIQNHNIEEENIEKSGISDVEKIYAGAITKQNGQEDFCFKAKKLKHILLIDDMADQGWSVVFNEIFKENSIYIKTLKEGSYSTKEELCTKTLEYLQINHKTTLCIFLDMRIFPQDNYSISVKELTGYQLLHSIKETYPFLPVLITTSSNKVWTYTETRAIGADSYWNKEGVDNFFSFKESLNNYHKLQEIVSHFVKDEYMLLRLLGDTLSILKTEEKLWWKSGAWTYSDGSIIQERKIDKEKVCILFRRGIDLFVNYLHSDLNDIDSVSDYISLIIVHYGKIIELLHNKKEGRPSTWHGVEIRGKGDVTGHSLYSIRNRAAHTNNVILYEDFKDFIQKFCKYLSSCNILINNKWIEPPIKKEKPELPVCHCENKPIEPKEPKEPVISESVDLQQNKSANISEKPTPIIKKVEDPCMADEGITGISLFRKIKEWLKRIFY